jgi:two-component system, OmpR family, phosphate regulon response regulator PhoB
MEKQNTVLVIDDEAYIREFLHQVLSDQYQVVDAANGSEGLELAQSLKPDVILLDILMPGVSGVEVCRKLRSHSDTSQIHIIMLTALNEPQQRIQAFTAGADDYLAKPVHPDELLARVGSKVRRAHEMSAQPLGPATLKCGDVILSLEDVRLAVSGQNVDVGPVEFRILSLLMKRTGDLVTREELAHFVWGDQKSSDRALDPHINSLRRKLKGSQGELKTVYGSGYSLIRKAVGPES